MYSHPAHVWDRAVPGWEGFRTWYFICYHVDPMMRTLLAPNPLLALLSKSDAWEGKYIPVPLSYGGTE